MLRQLFESFYNNSIETIAKRLVAENENFSYVRNLNGVYEEYLNAKTTLRYLIKGNSKDNNEGGNSLLDGHKVAACLTCAIAKVRLIVCDKIDDTDELPYSIEMSGRMNEQLAVLSGLSCLYQYMLEDEEDLFPSFQSGSEIVLRLPKTKYDDRSKYLDSFVRGLYHSSLLSTINPLLLSHIYFMIEQYHRKCIELERALETSDLMGSQ